MTPLAHCIASLSLHTYWTSSAQTTQCSISSWGADSGSAPQSIRLSSGLHIDMTWDTSPLLLAMPLQCPVPCISDWLCMQVIEFKRHCNDQVGQGSAGRMVTAGEWLVPIEVKLKWVVCVLSAVLWAEGDKDYKRDRDLSFAREFLLLESLTLLSSVKKIGKFHHEQNWTRLPIETQIFIFALCELAHLQELAWGLNVALSMWQMVTSKVGDTNITCTVWQCPNLAESS
jgi:hypothetical protein